MKKIITLFIIYFIPLICISEGWKYISQLSRFNNTSKYIERLDCISPDYCLAQVGNGNLYKSTDQGKFWDSIVNLPYHIKEPSSINFDINGFNYYACNENLGTIFDPVYSKHIYKISKDYSYIKEVLFIDSNSHIRGLGSIIMLDSLNGLVTSFDNVKDGVQFLSFFITHDGWKNYERREIPLFFWKTGPIYTYDNENILCKSIGPITNIKGNDTVKRGGIIANYNFFKDEWTLLHTFPVPEEGYDGPFTYGPSNLKMVNDSVGYGMHARLESYEIGGDGRNYDVVFKTRDGGKNWTKLMDTLREGNSWDIQDINFYDERNGIIVGRFGKVMMTNDGGETWYMENRDEFISLNSTFVMFVDWAGQFPIIGTRLDGDIYRYEGDFFKFDFKSPLLFFPRKDAVGQERNLLFRWEELRDATSYHFQLSSDVGFNNILQESTAKQMQFPYNNLEPFTAYWWRVSSTNGDKTLWSEPHYFRTKMPEISTVSPNCNAIDQPDSTTLQWLAVKGAEKYRIRLSDTATFDTIVFELKNIINTEYKLNKLEYLKKYYWQVQAYRSDETGDWSEICSFTVEDNPASVSDDNSFRIIYPNPAGNFITLSESDTKLYTDYEIYDISGRLLQNSVLSSFRIDISLLERGSYYLRLLSPSGIATAGFLKME